MSTLSSTTNATLMAQARESLRGKWGLGAGTALLFIVIMSVVNIIPEVGWIISILIGGPMAIGAMIFALAISRKQEPKTMQIFEGFSIFSKGLVAYLLQFLFIFLWALLLIVPGIIAAISYSMTYFIIINDDEISALDAITKSKEMMRGNKWKYFCFLWRFFGWSILSILTCGIGFLWLWPYFITSLAQFYDDLKPTDSAQSSTV